MNGGLERPGRRAGRLAARLAAVAAAALVLSALAGGAFVSVAAAEGATAAPAAGHGEHKEPLFTWFTWDAAGREKEDPAHDYGPGFVWAIVNFVLLLFVLGRLLGKNVRTSVAERRRAIERALDEAEAAKRQAEERHAELDRRIRSLDADAKRLRDEVRAEAEKEARVILQRAQARAERIASDAERAIQSEALSARKALEREVALAALAAATKILQTKIEPDDKRRLEDEYLKQIS